jgi:hypothetical protein
LVVTPDDGISATLTEQSAPFQPVEQESQTLPTGYISKSQDWTMEAIITLSDHCSLNREQITWPARTWCSTFTSRHFPRWSGSACSTPCVSGDLSVFLVVTPDDGISATLTEQSAPFQPVEQESQTLPTKFDKHPHVPLLAKQVPPPHGKLAENGQMF